MSQLEFVRTSVLDIAYECAGPPDGLPVLLLHGFPYDTRSFDRVTPILNGAGLRTIVPYLRGYGQTKFLSPDTVRSGEQSALAHDLLELLDGLQVQEAVLAGFDWGGRAACIVAALWPNRVRGLVSCCGYQIQNIPQSVKPADPEQEHRFWYQYYFHTERGRAGLKANRNAFCRLLWQLWSPSWAFSDETFNHSAASFDNPDFVDVVIHSYRHRMGNTEGDPRYETIEAQLSRQPTISVPTIAIHGAVDGVNPIWTSEGHEKYFTNRYERRILEDVGHNPPQEAPEVFAEAILGLCSNR